MAYQRTQAQKLLTASELALFDAGRSTEIRKLDKPTLRSKLERARKLRDKYRDLYRRQRVASQQTSGSKTGARGTANQRTQQKEEILAESVVRFEARLAQIEKQEDLEFAKAEKAALASTGSLKKAVKKAVAKKASARKAAAKKSPRKGAGKTARRNQSLADTALPPKAAKKTSRATQIGAHQRAANKRGQAKRDSR